MILVTCCVYLYVVEKSKESDDGFVAKLVTQIIKNIQVWLENWYTSILCCIVCECAFVHVCACAHLYICGESEMWYCTLDIVNITLIQELCMYMLLCYSKMYCECILVPSILPDYSEEYSYQIWRQCESYISCIYRCLMYCYRWPYWDKILQQVWH